MPPLIVAIVAGAPPERGMRGTPVAILDVEPAGVLGSDTPTSVALKQLGAIVAHFGENGAT